MGVLYFYLGILHDYNFSGNFIRLVVYLVLTDEKLMVRTDGNHDNQENIMFSSFVLVGYFNMFNIWVLKEAIVK